MSNKIKMTVEGTRDDLINLIDFFPLDAVLEVKNLNPENRFMQVRELMLDADWFEENFKTKPRCSPSNTGSLSKQASSQ